ncbi:acetolactate synthase, large subunit [Saccharopolyspora shandongensis]|uniref:Acetolactate synthase n=2 Tax=Saccharopolyspora shandongensis TaxID=418495 RepID=A0A1H3SYJ3_9PSEU|nr:acetolactate synthase large subunit [Saccharopolyspora shandongensis]SDZ42641.1 acetolactate synthase, large subunit [Saccharopolyspora shandongensis]
MVVPSPRYAERITGAQALLRSLELAGTEVIFGLPGGAILPAYDALVDSKTLRHVLVRHEQCAGHAARGYAQATGRVGVCLVTSGPGATNLVTPLADAYRDSIPIVAITGQVPSTAIGTDAFQEIDVLGITLPITKHGFAVTDAEQIPAAIADAFRIARAGRPGPVVVDVCKDALLAATPFPGLLGSAPQTPTIYDEELLRSALKLLSSASRPVLYVGGGAVLGDAAPELLRFAEHTGIPVVTTLMGLGVFPDSHPLHMGMPGMHGSVAAVGALQQADLLIAVGVRFDDRVTGQLSTFAPGAQVIHIDIDATEVSRVRHADVPLVGNCKQVLGELHRLSAAEDLRYDFTAWTRILQGYQKTYRPAYEQPAEGLSAPRVLRRLSELAAPEAIYVTGVGQHQMWAAQCIGFERPRSLITSGGLGTMGVAVPAAMGAKMALPEREVWAIDGDGCFQMTHQELATCVAERIPIKIAVINNGSYGMVRQWQNLFYDQRYSQSELNTVGSAPDFVRLAEAYGCVGLRCTTIDELDDVVRRALEITDTPVVIDFQVPASEMVWPMIEPGVSNDDIAIARGMSPCWDTSIVREEVIARNASNKLACASPRAVFLVTRDTPYVVPRVTATVRRCGLTIDRMSLESRSGRQYLELFLKSSGDRVESLMDSLRNLADVLECKAIEQEESHEYERLDHDAIG